MTATTDDERFRQPTIKRLGLDDGWWFFCPHFLNLGLPLVFVDTCLLPRSDALGLESLSTRRPDTPLPLIDLRIGLLGNGVSLLGAGRNPQLVAGHWFRELTLPLQLNCPYFGIIVGDSYALQSGWSALWTCLIGTAARA